MGKLKSLIKFKVFSTSSRKKSPASKAQKMGLVNSAIAILSLLLVAFIFSFSNRQTQSGVPIEVTFPTMSDAPKLATEIFGMKHVAEALGFDINNSSQVITAADPNLDVDITLVIGKDFRSISSIQAYLNN